MRCALWTPLVSVCLAHCADLTASEQLAQIREQMTRTLSRLPNYTCRETIDRSVRASAKQQGETTDRIRLEVAFLEGREMFAWPGSPRFGDQTLADLVPFGAMSSGSFGSLAHAVFTGGGAVFTFDGQTTLAGRTLLQFSYRVPLEASSLVLRRGKNSAIVAYQGVFTADAATHDVLRFEVSADEIPPGLGLQQGIERTEYGRSRIGDSDYPLPTSAETVIFDSTGGISRNRIAFDACREYKGESTLSFGDAGANGAPSAAVASRPMPAGIELQLRLAAPVERGVTAIGDLVFGEITRDVRGPVPIPKGARAALRIVHMESFSMGPEPVNVVGFELLSIESEGQPRDVAGVLQSVKGSRYHATQSGQVSFGGASLRIPPGLEMSWRTAAHR